MDDRQSNRRSTIGYGEAIDEIARKLCSAKADGLLASELGDDDPMRRHYYGQAQAYQNEARHLICFVAIAWATDYETVEDEAYARKNELWKEEDFV